jgi:hypothetical protein
MDYVACLKSYYREAGARKNKREKDFKHYKISLRIKDMWKVVLLLHHWLQFFEMWRNKKSFSLLRKGYENIIQFDLI